MVREEVSGYEIAFEVGDLLDWDFLSKVMQRYRPDAAVHFAEQRAAPYSMISRVLGSRVLHWQAPHKPMEKEILDAP